MSIYKSAGKWLGAAALTLLAPSVAGAADEFVGGAGNSCHPGFGGTTIFLYDYGAGNPSTVSTNSYLCPVNWGVETNFNQQRWIDGASLIYNDRNPLQSFVCYIYVNSSGSQYWSATRETCSTDVYQTTGWSCSTNTGSTRGGGPTRASFTGTGVMEWYGADLPWGGSLS